MLLAHVCWAHWLRAIQRYLNTSYARMASRPSAPSEDRRGQATMKPDLVANPTPKSPQSISPLTLFGQSRRESHSLRRMRWSPASDVAS
jgi:hypothetical protein